MMFHYRWKCAWGHADPQGIAYYPRLVNAMHRAGEEFMDEAGVAYWDIPDDYDVHLPLVAVDFEFERPVTVGDTVEITVEPDLGTKSLGFDFTATHEDGSVAYTGHEQHVCVSAADNQSRELPDDLRDIVDEESS
ncbi:acyl-CoA thioesterase [Halococcus sp. IIIV-5B]|nr:acyl-CoA thioesterase [Halococcus sp. IIIV-5B]